MRTRRLARRRDVGDSGAQVEARGMQRAFDMAVLDPAVGERGLLVRAGVVEREELALLGVEDSDRRIGVQADRLTGRQLGERASWDHADLCCIMSNVLLY